MAASIASDHATIATEVYVHKERPSLCDLCWAFMLDDFVEPKVEEAKATAAMAKKKKLKQKESPKKRFAPLSFSDDGDRFESYVPEPDFDEENWQVLADTKVTDGEPIVFKSEKERKEYKEYLEWRKKRQSTSKHDEESLHDASLYSEYTNGHDSSSSSSSSFDDASSSLPSQRRLVDDDGSVVTLIEDDPLFACFSEARPGREVLPLKAPKSKDSSRLENGRKRSDRGEPRASREQKSLGEGREKIRSNKSTSIGDKLREKMQEKDIRLVDKRENILEKLREKSKERDVDKREGILKKLREKSKESDLDKKGSIIEKLREKSKEHDVDNQESMLEKLREKKRNVEKQERILEKLREKTKEREAMVRKLQEKKKDNEERSLDKRDKTHSKESGHNDKQEQSRAKKQEGEARHPDNREQVRERIDERDMRNPDKMDTKWRPMLWRKDRPVVPDTKPPRPSLKTTIKLPSSGARNINGSKVDHTPPATHIETRRPVSRKVPAPKSPENRRKPQEKDVSKGAASKADRPLPTTNIETRRVSPRKDPAPKQRENGMRTKGHDAPTTHSSLSKKQDSTSKTRSSTKQAIAVTTDEHMATVELPPPISLTRRVHSYDGVVQSTTLESLTLPKTMTKSPPFQASSQSVPQEPAPQEASTSKTLPANDQEVNHRGDAHFHPQDHESRPEPSVYQEQPREVLESNHRALTPPVVGGAHSAFSPLQGKIEVLTVQSIDDEGEERQIDASSVQSLDYQADEREDSVAATTGESPDHLDRDAQSATPEEAIELPESENLDFEDNIEWIATAERNPYEHHEGSDDGFDEPLKETISAMAMRKPNVQSQSNSPHRAENGRKTSTSQKSGLLFIRRVRSGDSSAKSVDRGSYGIFRNKNWGRTTDAESVL
jgi:hypothetical protein